MRASSLFLILIGAILALRGVWVIVKGRARNLGSPLELTGAAAMFMGISYLVLGLVLFIVAVLPDESLVFISFVATLLFVRWGIPALAENIHEQQQGVPIRPVKKGQSGRAQPVRGQSARAKPKKKSR